MNIAVDRNVRTMATGPRSPKSPVGGETKRCSTASAIDAKANAHERKVVAKKDDMDGRQMFDKRTLRRRHRESFEQQITRWNEGQSTPMSFQSAPSRVTVCVRKRPLFEYEKQAEEFDVVTAQEPEIVVHNCLTKANLQSLYVSHMGFRFSHVFDEYASDDEVYIQSATPAVDHVLQNGIATIFMFGQTGSGKTHTMSGLMSRAIEDLFAGDGRDTGRCPLISITAFEIAGKTMRDLLDPTSSPQDIKVMEDKGHCTRVVGISSQEVQSPTEAFQLLREAQAVRTTRATQANDTSSRSHAVYRISISNGNTGATQNRATLTLVDCAGSERNEDSTHHDAQSRKDMADINSAIFALKECFRVMRSPRGQQPPFRESLLTRVLSDSFATQNALVVAIGTVSPSAADTEHSLCTLRALQSLQGTQMAFEEQEDVPRLKDTDAVLHPKTWSEDDVRKWLDGAIGGRARAFVPGLSSGTDGKNLLRWPPVRFKQLCGGSEDLGNRLYQDLRLKMKVAGA